MISWHCPFNVCHSPGGGVGGSVDQMSPWLIPICRQCGTLPTPTPSLCVWAWIGKDQRVLNDLKRNLFSWFGSSTTQSSPLPVSKISPFLSGRKSLLTWGGNVWGRGTKSYDREKAWPSINHSILSGGRSHLSKISKFLFQILSLFISIWSVIEISKQVNIFNQILQSSSQFRQSVNDFRTSLNCFATFFSVPHPSPPLPTPSSSVYYRPPNSVKCLHMYLLWINLSALTTFVCAFPPYPLFFFQFLNIFSVFSAPCLSVLFLCCLFVCF